VAKHGVIVTILIGVAWAVFVLSVVEFRLVD
jgi:hypothetical protein